MLSASSLNTPEPPEPCSGFRMMLCLCALAKALMSRSLRVMIVSARASSREALEIELVDGPPEAVRIVEDDDPAFGRFAAEQYPGLHRPGRFGVDRRIVAQHQNVDLGQVDRLDLAFVDFSVSKNSLRSLYFCLGRKRAWARQAVVLPQNEIGRRQIADTVTALPSPGGRARSSCSPHARAPGR